MGLNLSFGFGTVVIFLVLFLAAGIRVLNEYERGVVFRLGRLVSSAKGPGIIYVIPMIDKMTRVSLRLITMDVPPQDVITKDNVSVKVNAVVYFRVLDVNKAVIDVQDFLYATAQKAQTTLRSVAGEFELDDLLTKREEINGRLQTILDKQTDPWGVKVQSTELKHIDLPKEMQRAMAKQAEAERERRAKVIAAEGEHQAAGKMAEAAALLEKHPSSLQLRYLQTLREIATENNSTTLFPIPMDIITPFVNMMKQK